ncbi:HAD family phosphatase [Geomonas sp.]|uniref:HAD family hydrolase n=1 Tax=Geomonas sp. TaxID=2651584 RepID=UPI002B475E6E|nr:HAD family phosphatase [Geomonas sp.]HJV36747.1 HAD family phosphatase [Geomonas sp.]
MKREEPGAPITALFLDIGGVLLTNGWDGKSRRLAAETFALDFDDMNERHHLTFDTYEEGKLSLDDYLDRVVFFKERPFTLETFRAFMFEQSRPLPGMIDLVCRLKKQYGLKLAAVSNEGRELNLHRIRTFRLASFIDLFVSSCFVHFRKPDTDMFRIALDLAQAEASRVIYLEDRPMFVEVARGLGLNGILHTGREETERQLADFGLVLR